MRPLDSASSSPFTRRLRALARDNARRLVLGALVLLLAALAVQQAVRWAERTEIRALDERLRQRLDTFSAQMQSELEAFDLPPVLLAGAHEVTDLLTVPGAPGRRAAANAFLERFNAATRASDSYILDETGTTLAASNWRTGHSFVGHNYRFRPYFKAARDGGTGHYVAFGVTSKVLGYYVSVPVRIGGAVRGVAVVKYAIADILHEWRGKSDVVLVADANGIVFAASNAGLQFRTLAALPPAMKAAIRANNQYPAHADLTPVPLAAAGEIGDVPVAALPLSHRRSGADPLYILERHRFPRTGWQILALADAKDRHRGATSIIAFGVLAACLALLLMIHLEDRRTGRQALAANEARLRKSEEHLARAQRVAEVGSWELDLATGTVVWSDECYRMVGQSPGRFAPTLRHVLALHHPDDRWRVWHLARAALRGIAPPGFDVRIVRSDGETRFLHCECEPVLDRAGAMAGLLGTAQDVTERKAAEEALHRAKARAEAAEARLVDALETMSEGFALYDAEDRLVLCNAKYKEIYPESADLIVPGASFETVVREGVRRGQYPEAAGREDAWIAERMAQHRGSHAGIEQELPNGRWVRIVERRTADGGRVGVRVDITALKRREAELRLARDEAQAASRTKSEFLATISHELRTPLNAVIGFSEVIRDALMGPVNARYRDYAGDIHKSGRHLLSLINDVLDLSKIEVGRLDLHEDELDVADVIQSCVPLVAERAARGGVALAANLAPDLPLVRADELRLKQIVLNLLSNAVKFTPAGGRAEIAVELSATGDLAIAVRDSGIGMKPEDIPVALEPFRQIDGALNRRYEGTGLGLPLARTLAELHGGRLEIESAPGRGTTVTVTLPCERVLAAADGRRDRPSVVAE